MNIPNAYSLIKTLSRSEKRYFKLSISFQKGDKLYLRLFDILENQKVFDEHALKNKFSSKAFLSQLSNRYNQLYRLLLKSLRQFHEGHIKEWQIANLIRESELLFERGLFSLSHKLVKQAKEQATKYEAFLLMHKINELERDLFYKLPAKDSAEAPLRASFKSQQIILQKLLLLVDFNKTKSLLFYDYMKEGQTPRNENALKKLETYLINLPGISSYKSSFRSTLFRYTVLAHIHEFRNNFKKTYDYRNEILKLFDQHTQIKDSEPYNYIYSLQNYFNACNRIGEYGKGLEAINEMKSIALNIGNRATFYRKADLFQGISVIESDLYIMQGHFLQAMPLVKEIELGLKEYKNYIEKDAELILYYNISYICLGVENYKLGLHWANKITNYHQPDIRLDIQQMARILILILCYELGDDDLLYYNAKNTYRYLLRQDSKYQTEKEILAFIRKSVHSTRQEVQIDLFRLRTTLVELMDEELEKNSLSLFDFLSWIDAKIKNRPFAEIVQEKGKKVTI